jgi:4-hydroxy-2-oxoheptanedioate aldolase
MRTNRVKAKLKAGEPSVGSWLGCGNSLSAELMAHIGFDWLVVNTEHEAIDVKTMQSMLQAISTTDTVPMVRVVWNDIMEIKRPLDCGAYGVVIPMVNSREEAVKAVQCCKYPPMGIRGIGGARRALYGGPDYFEHANEEIAVIVQIETAEAFRNADEILSVEGIDAFFIGPNDLSASMGIPPSLDSRHPRFVEAARSLVKAGKQHGVAAGIHCGTPEAVNEAIAWGFQFIALSSDMGLMVEAARDGWAKVKRRSAHEGETDSQEVVY